jgi:hypothetical protein
MSADCGAVTVTLPVTPADAPSSSATVSVTLYVPAAAYVCNGPAMLDVPPSPNVQARVAIVPSVSVDVSVNVQVRSEQLLVKDAAGALFGGGEAAHV